jgi:hypothetical protein
MTSSFSGRTRGWVNRRSAPGASIERPFWANLSRWLFYIPEAQAHPLDLRYQHYLYELFHQTPLSRKVHVIGMVASTASALTWAASLTRGGDAVLGLALLSFQLVMGLRHELYRMLPTIAGLNVALWIFVRAAWTPFQSGLAERIPLVSPFSIMLAAAFAQAIAHALESRAPDLANGGWRPMREWLKHWEPWSLVPGGILTEFISSPRNLFLIWIEAARGLGAKAVSWEQWLPICEAIRTSDNPPVRRHEFLVVLESWLPAPEKPG